MLLILSISPYSIYSANKNGRFCKNIGPNTMTSVSLSWTLLALASSVFASLLNFALSWFFIFRHKSFEVQTANLEKRKKELEEAKAVQTDDGDKKQQKKIKRIEDEINNISTQITTKTFRFTMVLNILLFVINRTLKAVFEGVVVAKIPFAPFGLLTKITHSGLETDDISDANYQFIYWIGTTIFKDALNRFFGYSMPAMTMPNRLKSPHQD